MTFNLLYCNPLPLPDYPRGRFCDNKDQAGGWTQPYRPDFRELADPTVLYIEGKWYMYPSGCMVYVTEDFVNWTLHPMTPLDIGYAPTVVEAGGVFYLTACNAALYRSDSPLGPFELVGDIQKPDGEVVHWLDPMLFYEDGRLFAYWGISDPGIFGVEMDASQPNRMKAKPEILFSFNPEHEWERYGDYNEDHSKSFVEGAWMVKVNGTYFLTYAGPGTQWKTYGMGTYVSDNPLGPFTYQQRNPILRHTQGVVTGPGHGCIVEGPNDTLWAFYTCICCNYHVFERRIGMDPAGIDGSGNLFVIGSTETPQQAPGTVERRELGNDSGLLPLTVTKPCTASSYEPGRTPHYVVDQSHLTWWEPTPEDRERPWLRINLQGEYEVSAIRVMWSENGLDYPNGKTPVPVPFTLEAGNEPDGPWEVLVDASENKTDWLIDFRTFAPHRCKLVRLTMIYPKVDFVLGISNLTIFGVSTAKR